MELLKNLEGLSADEQMSAVVELQKAAMKHLEEQKQASIGKSAEMVILGLKKIKSDFEAKFDSLNYDIQTKVANLKDGAQGLQGPKGEQGDRGLDGYQGKDGKSGIDGKDGLDGKDGVSVQDAKIDFDGSLVITLSDGREINVGEVVPVDVAEKIRTVHNIQSGSGGDSQTVLDAIAALQATIATYGTMATQNANNVAITGGTINNTTIGATTPSTGVFTTLTATGQTSLGGVAGAEGLRVLKTTSSVNFVQATGAVTDSNPAVIGQGGDTEVGLDLGIRTGGFNYIRQRIGSTGFIDFSLNAAGSPALKTNTTSGQVNYHQLTGSATGSGPIHSVAGSDTNIDLNLTTKGSGSHVLNTGGGTQFKVLDLTSATTSINARGGVNGGNAQFGLVGTGNTDFIQYTLGTGAFRFLTNGIGVDQFRIAHTASAVNYVQVTGATTGNFPTISAEGSDATTGLIFLSKGSSGLVFRTRGGGTPRNAFIMIDNGASSVNYLTSSSNVASSAPSLSATGTDTNIPLVLQPKGTGALQAQQTDSTATGGNARGANAVDWQTGRSIAAQVASGSSSGILGGFSNSATGQNSFVLGGAYNTSSGYSAVVAGGYANQGASNFFTGILSGYGNSAAGYLNIVVGGYSNSGTSASAVTTQSATMNGTTAVTLSGSNANIKVGQLVTGTSISNFPNTYVAAISGTSLTLSQAASGSSTSTLSFFTPHGVVVGGGNNQATGSYSYIGGGGDAGTAANRNVASGDWSVVVGGQTNTASNRWASVGGGQGNTASGEYSFVAGGSTNTSSGQLSFTSGYANSASGGQSFIGGGNTHAADSFTSAVIGGAFGTSRGLQSNTVFPASVTPIASTRGASQAALMVLGRQTTDATATVLTSNTSAAGTTNQVILPNNSAYYFRGEVVSGVTGGGNTKGWTIEGVIKRGANAAATTLVGSTVTSLYADAGAATWTIALSADTTNGGLAVTFTGQAATTIRTVCQIRTTEMTF